MNIKDEFPFTDVKILDTFDVLGLIALHGRAFRKIKPFHHRLSKILLGGDFTNVGVDYEAGAKRALFVERKWRRVIEGHGVKNGQRLVVLDQVRVDVP
ncbi:hypothetical protein PanWU01x14_212180 [Parasponia andersonii]|uniref:Uncharacterized protein n=1 Tax=Parasponia andersonii TaxID=3476 RepID=A0A2P5BT83_PARAD|nr:hypothetical protein PanWU01x14_212180 [Parasponia andersonii]